MVKTQDMKGIVKKLKDRDDDRTNFSFRLSKKVVKSFKDKCEKEGISNSGVLEELMTLFISAMHNHQKNYAQSQKSGHADDCLFRQQANGRSCL